MTASGPFDFETRDTGRGAEDSYSAMSGAKYEFSQGGIARICADDVDEAAEQIRDWRVELTQLERGPAHVRGILVPLGNTLVGRGQCTRALCARGAAPAESISFLFNVSDVPGRAGSLALDSSTCVVYGSGAELNNYCASGMLSVAISVSQPKWLELQQAFRFDLACDDGRSLFLTISPQCNRSIAALIEGLCKTAEGRRDPATDPKRITAFEDSFLALLSSIFTTPRKAETAARERVGRHRAVMRAQEFIHENLGEPLSLPRICDASLASARTLEYGFQELFGISPLTYVRFERLGRVHRELHRGHRSEASVTDVAMRWGFWHLGQFSKEYRGLFGECPSATLSRARYRNSGADLATTGTGPPAN